MVRALGWVNPSPLASGQQDPGDRPASTRQLPSLACPFLAARSWASYFLVCDNIQNRTLHFKVLGGQTGCSPCATSCLFAYPLPPTHPPPGRLIPPQAASLLGTLSSGHLLGSANGRCRQDSGAGRGQMTIHPGLPAVVSASAAFINLSPQLLPATPSPGSGFLGFLQLLPLSLPI